MLENSTLASYKQETQKGHGNWETVRQEDAKDTKMAEWQTRKRGNLRKTAEKSDQIGLKGDSNCLIHQVEETTYDQAFDLGKQRTSSRKTTK